MRLGRVYFIMLAAAVLFYPAHVGAEITKTDIEVRILYDNSGSMYPGYRISGLKRHQLGVQHFHRYPTFRESIKKFILYQRRLNATSVSVYAFTDLQLDEIHPETDPDSINADEAFSLLPKQGQRTHFTENLVNLTEDFEGLVWLVTDNVIDPREGNPDNQDVLKFFRHLNESEKYRSVHIYNYRFSDDEKNQYSNIAFYALLVSSESIDTSVIEYYDRKLMNFRDVFPDGHLKLKDLRINPLELDSMSLRIIIYEKNNSLFDESKIVKFILEGAIQSRLTQHTVTEANYDIRIISNFEPTNYPTSSVDTISSSHFEVVAGPLDSPIEPESAYPLQREISSDVPINIAPKDISTFIKAAFGVRVNYQGIIRLSVFDIKVNLQRERLEGIYGIDQASHVFDFQDVKTIDQIKPYTGLISFQLETASKRGIALLILLVLVVIPIIIVSWLVLQPQKWVCPTFYTK
ncbi:MAG: hypothetical protein GY749_20575 [Desulfobacteraceae bacterium]|nr:hypothetical protein [Desulfobacteraceae bacterium]